MDRIELNSHMSKWGITSHALAEALGVSYQAVDHWVWGRRKVPATVSKIMRYFNAKNMNITKELNN